MSCGKFVEFKSKQSLQEEHLFTFLHTIMMTKEKNKFPLLGDFIMKNGRSFAKEPLSWSDFSEVQIVLIYYFSDITRKSYDIQVSLYLLSYWLKDQEKDTFARIFKDDNIYWKTVLDFLEPHLRKK
jgi:hypothetical protein